MSDKLDKEIVNWIRRIAGRRIVVFSGVVKSVDADNNEVEVQLTINDATTDDTAVTTEGVLLNVTTANKNGVYMIPAVGADCEVAEVDGPGKWSVLRASSYTKIALQVGDSIFTIIDGSMQFNGDALGGLTKTLELKTQLNKNNALLQHLISIINGSPITEPGNGAPSALQAALKAAIAADELGDFGNIENTKVKQG